MIDINIIIFDIDGTLVDSKKDIVNAINVTLRKFNLPEKDPELITSFIGTGMRDLISKSLGAENMPLTDQALPVYIDYYLTHISPETKLYPHVIDTLNHFKNKTKIILTNRIKKSAELVLTKLKIKDYFAEIIGGDDENCKKPLACPLERSSFRSAIDKNKTIIVGDLDVDIQTGKNFGIKTCWASYGLGKCEAIEPLEPDYVIDNFMELKEVIK